METSLKQAVFFRDLGQIEYRDAWDLQADGSYLRVGANGSTEQHGAQQALMARYSAGGAITEN